ncbi:MAG: cysteine--tRNA ligase [Candidatus Omnitrophica bacterium]|nr:cysteine--tRNA ligase [Candidatus Omnitrophota bacterium]
MKIYNSLTRKKEEFVPIKSGRIGMYVCGPTVYDEPHIGHARSAYIFDVIRNYLEYRKFKVTFVRNVTDVDDKIIEKAKSASSRQPSAVSLKEAVKEVSKKYLDSYHEDMELLGMRKPDKEPKATEYIPKMKKFIELLIKKGCAYEADGDVYFDIKKAKSYGKLSNQNIEKMEVGARISPGEKKKDALDFALWKTAKEDEPSWKSPWGEGRPGWHIECSVMSSDILGDEFDIHGGGIDLIFPHHENEIAQSEGAGKGFARYWLHNGLLTINGEKMAKSLGNYISIKDFVSKHDADYLKLLFLSVHYRHPVDYTEEKIAEMKSQKERISIFLQRSKEIIEKFEKTYKERPNFDPHEHFKNSMKDVEAYKERFEKAMDDDFNTPQALAEIFNIVHCGNLITMTYNDLDNDTIRYTKLKYSRDLIVEYLTKIFGLFLKEPQKTLDKIEKNLIDERNEARKRGEFKKADEFRRILLDKYNIILEDTKDGTTWRRKV